MTPGNRGNRPISAKLISELREEIKQLKSIMVAVATGGPRIQDKETEYEDLYQQIDSKIRHLRSTGVDIENPNTFKSLWDWYGYWSSTLPRYQNRRDYINHMYEGILSPLESALSQKSGDPDEGSDIGPPQILGPIIMLASFFSCLV